MALDRGVISRLSVQRLSKRFGLRGSTRDYNKVDDTSDTRIPLHNDEAFQHGIKFKAKYIGSLEIARPTSKLDIITAMRRIRYEFKVKGVKKQRVMLDVSVQGVKLMKRKRRKKKQYSEDELLMMQHPVYRIFYVSHDSQDLKIFSYITREVPNNTFKCNVFKAYKKTMALHIVRTLGQAFDVCHKLNPRPKKKKPRSTEGDEEGEGNGEKGSNAANEATSDDASGLSSTKQPESEAQHTEQGNEPPPGVAKELITLNNDPFSVGGTAVPSANGTTGPDFIAFDPLNTSFPPPLEALTFLTGGGAQNGFSTNFTDGPGIPVVPGLAQTQSHAGTDQAKMQEMPPPAWELEKQQYIAQIALLTDKVRAETNTRIEAEARVEHLHLQNKELLSHVQKLMLQVQQLKQSLEQTKQPATEPATEPPSEKTEPAPAPSEPPTEATNSSHDQAVLDKAFTVQRKMEETHDQETLDKAFSPAHSALKENIDPTHDEVAFDAAFTTAETSNL